jgi:hypothetical protein
LRLLRRWLPDPHSNAGLFPKQCKQQGQDDADEDGGDNGKVESEILFSDDDVSGKSSDPRNFFTKKQEKANQNNKNPKKYEYFPQRTKSNHLKCLLINILNPSPNPSVVCPTFLYFWLARHAALDAASRLYFSGFLLPQE